MQIYFACELNVLHGRALNPLTVTHVRAHESSHFCKLLRGIQAQWFISQTDWSGLQVA